MIGAIGNIFSVKRRACGGWEGDVFRETVGIYQSWLLSTFSSFLGVISMTRGNVDYGGGRDGRGAWWVIGGFVSQKRQNGFEHCYVSDLQGD